MNRGGARRAAAASLARAVCLLPLAAAGAQAQPFEMVGARALGMAGAFVAVADDATAAYWNPAGLTTGHFLSLLADHSDFRWRRGPRDASAPDGAGAIFALSTNDVAFSYYRVRVDHVRSVRTHNAAFTGARSVRPGVSVGASVRYVRGAAGGNLPLSAGDPSSGAGPVGLRSRNTFDLDLGVMVGGDAFRIGLVARNLRKPRLELPGGGDVRLERHVRAGVAARPAERLVIAADVDLGRARPDLVDGSRRSVAVGAEYWLGQWFAVRGGARVNAAAENAPVVSAAGFSVALASGVYLDGQYTRGRGGAEQSWGVAARVGF